MAKNIMIVGNTIGAQAGNFSIYSDDDSYASPLTSSITPVQLTSGFLLNNVPNTATALKIVSDTSDCSNDLTIAIGTTTTTTTTTTTSTTTTTTTFLCYEYALYNDGTSAGDVYYSDCSTGSVRAVYLVPGETRDVCAREGSVNSTLNGLVVVKQGVCT
jgi:hypothetical protein